MLDRTQVALHERADSRAFGFLAHLEGVADFDVFDAIEGIFARDRLIRHQSAHLIIVLRLFKIL